MKTPAIEIEAGTSEVIVTIGKGEASVTTLRLSPDEAALIACDLAAASRDARRSKILPLEELRGSEGRKR